MRAEPGQTVAVRAIATTAALILSALACVDMPVTPMVDDSSLTVPDEGVPAMQAAASSDLADGQLIARSEVCGTVEWNKIVMYDERIFHPAKTNRVGRSNGDWDSGWRLGPGQIRHYTFYRPASNTTNPHPPIGDWAQFTAVQYRRWGGDRTDYSYPVRLELWDLVVSPWQSLRIEYQHYNMDVLDDSPSREDYWLTKSFVDAHPTADKVIRETRPGGASVKVTTNCTLTNIMRYSSRPYLAIVSDPGPDNTYAAGETIRIRARFSKPVEATGDATLLIRFGPNFPDKAATLNEDASEGQNVYFDWVVREPNYSTVGVGVPSPELAPRSIQGGKIVLRDEWIPGPAYPVDDPDDKVEIPVIRWYRALPHDPRHKADWRIRLTGTGALVTGVSIVSDPGPDGFYVRGDRIRVGVRFDAAVHVSGNPTIDIDMDPADWGTKSAVYESGSGTSCLVFVHEVVQPNWSPNGIAVLANTLTGSSITSGGEHVDPRHSGVGHDSSHRVDWTRSDSDGNTYGSCPN